MCGTLRVSSSLISGNRAVGIVSSGPDMVVTSTVVRDTLPDSNGKFGRGIAAQCDLDLAGCGSLAVTSCLVQGSQSTGIYISGVPATLDGVTVRDTVTNAVGEWRGEYGQAIWASCDPLLEICATLDTTASLVESCTNAGLAIRGVSGTLRSSVVRQITAQELDDRYGFGVQIEGLEWQQGAEELTFHVSDCEIRDAKLAGLLYYRARGTLARTVISGGENSVIMNEGSSPTILDDNELSGTIEDEPTWASLIPSPAPPPTLPAEPVQPVDQP